MDKIQAIRGMHDILPEEIHYWQKVEAALRDTAASFSFDEIRMPSLEMTDLFCRSIGVATDIVEKEMYTFADRNGDSLTLRPEGTAGCVRACLQSGILHNQQQKLWYLGPMYRHERPQKGRTRQFHQFGIELFNIPGFSADVECIQFSHALFERLNILGQLRLEVNTLGVSAERGKHKDALVAYYTQHHHLLDEDSVRRLQTNPLRILDSKNPDLHDLNENAPKLIDYLGEASRAHFDALTSALNSLGIPYTVNPRLVRGLDYYTHTVFEWITDSLGAQGTVCGGGRYDGLVEQLGGKPTPGVGFALGMERLIELTKEKACTPQHPHICILPMGDKATVMGLSVAKTLRQVIPGLRVSTVLGGGSVKSLFKRADKSQAEFAIIIGDEEVNEQHIIVKALREETEQSRWPLNADLMNFLASTFDLKCKTESI